MSTEREQQFYNALCINYTAAYCCDLMNDTMEPVKQQPYAHSVRLRGNLSDPNSYSQWLQYSYEHVVDREVSPDYLEVLDARNLMQRLQTEESFVYPHKTFPNEKGMEWFETTVVRLYVDESSFQVILGYRPIDDIIEEEEHQREKLEEALHEAQRASQAKTEFLSRMSHDIRTPLNGIIGLLEINERHFDDRALVQENHRKMSVAANHLLSLINDVLQMSKLEDGSVVLTHEFISLVDLTQDIVNIIVNRAVESGLVWDYEKGKSVIPYPYIYGSPVHLRQIFLNIYGNCIKYNRPGGRITTIVDTLEEHDGICTYRWTISDTGVGMSQEFLQHIFEPFAQEKTDARSAYQGTGLGMAIVKNLLDQMSGTIHITSEVGVGSTFVITIPFEIAPPPESAAPVEEPESDISGVRLLLAEDNDLNAEIAQMLLEDKGASVTVVADGEQALKLFESNPAGTFDGILMDVMMPVMDGLAATRAIRALDRPDAQKIPIIAMTANAFEEDAKRCIAAGMNAHLAKPLDVKKMSATIARYCKNR